jgi:diaminopimelate epimerase
MTDGGWPFVKGDGTGNDFVLLPDPHGELRLTESLVRALCDRHRGIGADGVIRIAPTTSDPEVADQAAVAAWFMDYRNADGSVAQMCGNGARVMARYLVDSSGVPAGPFALATRSGPRHVDATDAEQITVDMGKATFPGPDGIIVRPAGTPQHDGPFAGYPAVAVDMGNPHAVAFVDDVGDAGPLLEAPVVTPDTAFPDGVNVEFAVLQGQGLVAMRVHERGSGETLSCGTGVCAVFAAARRRLGEDGPTARAWSVRVPGGTLTLRQDNQGSIHLTGPVQIVASGTLDAAWLDRHR